MTIMMIAEYSALDYRKRSLLYSSVVNIKSHKYIKQYRHGIWWNLIRVALFGVPHFFRCCLPIHSLWSFISMALQWYLLSPTHLHFIFTQIIPSFNLFIFYLFIYFLMPVHFSPWSLSHFTKRFFSSTLFHLQLFMASGPRHVCSIFLFPEIT